MHIALFEPNSDGHRYTHVRRLLPALAEFGRVTFVTSHEGVASPEYAAQVKAVEGCCTVRPMLHLDKKAPARTRLALTARALRALSREKGLDHVYMPYCDGTIQMAGLLRAMGRFPRPSGVELEGLMMRGSFAYQSGRGLKGSVRTRAWLAATQASPFETIHHMDPIVVRAMQRQAPRLARRVRLIPDPVEPFEPLDRAEARRLLGVPQEGRVIGCVGYQDRRKGIDLLIRAFLEADLAPGDRLLLAGKQEPAIKELLESPDAQRAVAAGRIILLARYISDEELRLAVAAMDVVCTPYPPHGGHSGSSSIAIHAAGQGRPCLGSDEGWIGDTLRRFSLGWTCPVTSPEAFARAVRVSLESAAGFTLTEGGARFVRFHRPDNFITCFTARIRARLGLPAAPEMRTWEWVEEAATSSGSA